MLVGPDSRAAGSERAASRLENGDRARENLWEDSGNAVPEEEEPDGEDGEQVTLESTAAQDREVPESAAAPDQEISESAAARRETAASETGDYTGT